MILSTDSTANLPKELYKQLNISMIPMQIILDDVTYDDLSEKLPVKEYYQKMREGAVPTTAQINEYSATEYFTHLLESGEDILHIAFSSALSGSTLTLKRVAEELNKTHKNKIVVVDSLNASCGEGLLVLKAKELLDEGKTIDDIKTSAMKTAVTAFATTLSTTYSALPASQVTYTEFSLLDKKNEGKEIPIITNTVTT